MVHCLRPRGVAHHNCLWFGVAQWAMNATTVVQRSTAGPERDHDISTGELSSAGGAAPRPPVLMSIHGDDVEIDVTDWLINTIHYVKCLGTQLEVPTLKAQSILIVVQSCAICMI